MRTMLLTLLLTLAACGGTGVDLNTLENAPILEANIAGLSGGEITDRTAGERATLTKLYEVSGSWEAASVALADAVQAHGWTIESINCVGTGNDVIAKKQIEGTWVLLESGAGAGGAGLILSIDAEPPMPVHRDRLMPTDIRQSRPVLTTAAGRNLPHPSSPCKGEVPEQSEGDGGQPSPNSPAPEVSLTRDRLANA